MLSPKPSKRVKKTNKTAYVFYNLDQDTTGEVWAEHEKCAKGNPTPPNCIKRKIGENSELPCNFCGK